MDDHLKAALRELILDSAAPPSAAALARPAPCPLDFDEHIAPLNVIAARTGLTTFSGGLTSALVDAARNRDGLNHQPLALDPPACFSAKYDPFPPIDAPWWANLQAALAPRARVVRNGGGVSSINATELVRGDIVIFRTGDRLTADLRVVALGSGDGGTDAALDVVAFYPEEEGAPRVLTLDASGEGVVDCMRATNVALAGMTVARGSGAGIVVKTGERTVVARVGRATLDEPIPFAAPGYSVALAKDVFKELCARFIAVRNPAAMPVLSAFSSSAEGGRVFVWAALPSLGLASAPTQLCAADAARVVYIGKSVDLEALAGEFIYRYILCESC